MAGVHSWLGFIRNHFGRRLVHFECGVGFLDLGGVLFQLGGERLDLLLLLRDRCSQVLNFQIEHGLLCGVGNGLGRDAGRFTGISAAATGNVPNLPSGSTITIRAIPFVSSTFEP